jgi:hypothetical protein
MAKLATSPIIQFVRGIAENERAKQLTDQELLDRFRSTRDEASFQALVRRHGVMVLDVCRNVLGSEVAPSRSCHSEPTSAARGPAPAVHGRSRLQLGLSRR